MGVLVHRFFAPQIPPEAPPIMLYLIFREWLIRCGLKKDTLRRTLGAIELCDRRLTGFC